jgi:hypothetical protein
MNRSISFLVRSRTLSASSFLTFILIFLPVMALRFTFGSSLSDDELPSSLSEEESRF